MKFLIDRCAGKVVADWLRGAGHDVLEARERGADPGDRVLLEWAMFLVSFRVISWIVFVFQHPLRSR